MFYGLLLLIRQSQIGIVVYPQQVLAQQAALFAAMEAHLTYWQVIYLYFYRFTF